MINSYRYSVASGWANDYATSFDGVDEYITIPTITELSNVSAFSISFWMTKPQASLRIPLELNKNATNNIFLFWRGTTGYLQFSVANGATASVNTATGVLSASGYDHIVLVYDGSLTGNQNRAKIFVNNVNKNSTDSGTIPATSATFTTEALTIAGRTTTYCCQAKFDEIRIYDYALTTGDISTIYNSGTPQEEAVSTDAVHKYRMGDGDTFPTVSDTGTGTAKDGTMTNMESGDFVTPP